jgi:hypothetical protein
MNMNTHPMSRITRLAVTLVLGILLLASVSCSAPDFGARAKENAAAIEQLESRFNELENGLGGVVFWQALAAVMFVLAGFALVGGAALGSRARRDHARFFGTAADTEQPRNLDKPSA